ncbi:FtsX-like permease family protein [Sanguibacter sp. A247]|uniref:FtsX-like permease family protein n=1 Tax=unclassified Sanguibacter TaxID=2645534 RepID=UPI003FD700BF
MTVKHGLLGLAVRRAAASRGPVLALGLLAALAVACVVGVLGQVEQSVRHTVSTATELAGDGDRLELRTRLLGDGAAQDGTVRAIVSDATGAANVTVTRAEDPDRDDTPFVTWTIAVDPRTLSPDDVIVLAAGLPPLESAVKASDAQSRGLVVSGGLVAATSGLAERVTAFRGVAVVPVLVLAVIGAVGLGRVVRQIVTGRRREDALLAARGIGPAHVRALAAAETATVTTLGAVAGAVGALAVLAATSQSVGDLAGRALLTAVATVAVTALTAAVLAGRQLDDLLRTEPRGTLATGQIVSGVVLAVAAVVATWRILVARGAQPDVLALAAPGVLLVALVLLGVAASAGVLAGLARRAARSPRLDRVLALRTAARRRGVRLPALVVALAVGALVLASAYAGTSAQTGARLAVLDAGADVRVAVAPSGSVAGIDVDPTLAGGAAASAAVVVRPAKVGTEDVVVLAAPADALAAVVRDGDGIAADIAGGPTLTGPVLGPDGLTVPVRAQLEGHVGELTAMFAPARPTITVRVMAAAWLIDDAGRTALVRSASTLLDAAGPASAQLRLVPEVSGAWRLAAVDVVVDEVLVDGFAGFGVTDSARDGLDVGTIGGAGEPVDVSAWERHDSPRDEPDAPPAAGQRVRPGTTARWMPPNASDASAPIPGVVDRTLATSLALSPGSIVPLTIAGSSLDVRVVSVHDRLPGVAAPALALDATSLRAAQLAAGSAPVASEEVWLRTTADDVAAPAAARALADRLAADGTWGAAPAAFTVVAAPRGTDVAAAFWTAGLAAVLLALAGLRSTTSAQLAAREGEVVGLRALGLAPRRLARTRVAESAWVIGAGVAVGVVSGGVVAALATPLLVRAATASVSTAATTLDLPPLLGGLAALLAAVALVIALYARSVVRQAADPDLREVSA